MTGEGERQEPFWPLHGIRLGTPDLELHVMTEADLEEVWQALPPDLELDPGATSYEGLGGRGNRRAVVAQGYWHAFGTWSPKGWALPFVVRREGRVIGGQWLEGPEWAADRTVDSSSWLVASSRGKGLGRQMRGAVLELAFGSLGAVAAVTSAYVENAPSLGVSRGLGYRETHTSVLEHNGRRLQHLRMEAAEWREAGHGAPVTVQGVAAAMPFFGLGAARD
ncbi:MAG: GNAT family N-acetyltransferase [Intrasporangium sp.]|uniref:GNAT family N-acetyltransferase n=1 Tax=Intrasporangium sp. TaxID=1925024 RepID=UPI003F7D0E06